MSFRPEFLREFWREVGTIAGWSMVKDLPTCCGQKPECISLDPHAFGLSQTQFQCRQCKRRGDVGATIGLAAQNWKALGD